MIITLFSSEPLCERFPRPSAQPPLNLSAPHSPKPPPPSNLQRRSAGKNRNLSAPATPTNSDHLFAHTPITTPNTTACPKHARNWQLDTLPTWSTFHKPKPSNTLRQITSANETFTCHVAS